MFDFSSHQSFQDGAILFTTEGNGQFYGEILEVKREASPHGEHFRVRRLGTPRGAR